MFLKSVVVLASMMCCIVFDGEGAAGADVNIKCPANFQDNATNTITCVINSTAIASANCAVNPTQVNFNFKKQTEQSSSSQCSANYPCTTPSTPSTPTSCSCTNKTTAGIMTYTFLFPATKTLDEKGTFTCTVCAGPIIDRQENCDSIKFESPKDDDSLSDGEIAGIVIGSLAGAACLVAVVVFLVIKFACKT